MNKIIKAIILLSVLTLPLSCQQDDSEPKQACGVADPAKDLPWMKAEIESWKTGGLYTYFYIEQGTYNEETVFLIQNCCPFCDTITPVMNCQGEVLWYAPMEQDKTKQISDIKVIWKAPGSECTI